MLDVIVKRSQWLNGKVREAALDRGQVRESVLYDSADGMMCCLGFACLAAGMEKKLIRGKTSPANVRDMLPETLSKLLTELSDTELTRYNSQVCDRLMELNDVMCVNDEAFRESEITFFGALVGLNFSFVD